MKKILIVVGIGSCLFLGVYLFGSNNTETTSPQEVRRVQVIEAVRGDIQQTHERSGFIEAEQETVLSAKITAVVDAIYKQEGDMVRKGEVLAVLDGSELRAQRYLADRSVSTQSELLEETEDYYDQKVDEMRAELDKSEKMYDQVKDEGDADEIDLAKKDVQIAQEALRSTKKMRDLQIQMSQSNVDITRSQLGVAVAQENATRIRAPFSGVVVARHIDEGALVSPGVGVFTVARSEKKEVEVAVAAQYGSSVQVGDVLQVRNEGSQMLDARVVSVSPQVDLRTRKMQVTVRLEDTKAGYLGEYVWIVFPGEKREDVTIIPFAALMQEYHDQSVFVEQEGRAKKVFVTRGAVSNDHVEILSGITEGQRIVIEGQHILREGDEIQTYE